MNTRKKAIHGLSLFLKGSERFLLLTGTRERRKPLLALAAAFTDYPPVIKVLFRVNPGFDLARELAPFFGPIRIGPEGSAIRTIGEEQLFADTTDPDTWGPSPSPIDIAVVYPIELLSPREGRYCIEDLIHRKADKVMMVTRDDTGDFRWTAAFNPVHVIWDAEPEGL